MPILNQPMSTFLIQREVKPDSSIHYYLVPGNLQIRAKSSMHIINPEVVEQYAATYPAPFEHVLTDVEVDAEEFSAFEDVKILSFKVVEEEVYPESKQVTKIPKEMTTFSMGSCHSHQR